MLRRILQKQFFSPKPLFTSKINYSYFNQQPPKFDASKDYYNILGVPKDTSDSQIKRSYYNLAKQYHPDVSKGNESKFKDISEAYEVLSSDDLKRQYDEARVFQEYWSRTGSSGENSYNYQQYQYQYQNMSPEEQ